MVAHSKEESNLINPWKMSAMSPLHDWLSERPEISCSAKVVYARLCRFAGRSGCAWPSIEAIATATGLYPRKVERALKELRDSRLIKTKRRGMGKSNVYLFLDHEWMHIHDNIQQPPDDDDVPHPHIRQDGSDICGRSDPTYVAGLIPIYGRTDPTYVAGLDPTYVAGPIRRESKEENQRKDTPYSPPLGDGVDESQSVEFIAGKAKKKKAAARGDDDAEFIETRKLYPSSRRGGLESDYKAWRNARKSFSPDAIRDKVKEYIESPYCQSRINHADKSHLSTIKLFSTFLNSGIHEPPERWDIPLRDESSRPKHDVNKGFIVRPEDLEGF